MFDFIKKYFPKEHSSKVEVAQNKELPKAKSNLGSVEPKKATSINKTVLFTVSGIFIIIFVYSFLAAIEKPSEKEKGIVNNAIEAIDKTDTAEKLKNIELALDTREWTAQEQIELAKTIKNKRVAMGW